MGKHYYIGIMSGTSLDGIDVALVAMPNNTISLLGALEMPFEPKLRRDILALCQTQTIALRDFGQLCVRLSLAYAKAVNQLLAQHQLNGNDICAIGCHGQTVYHLPGGPYPFSMQLINASVLATETGITTISDFRSMDLALGGQGAPLVPPFHRQLFEHLQQQYSALVLLNIGGIANVSILSGQPLVGFDTGPGNVLMDLWLQQQNPEQLFDHNGELAAKGQVCDALLADCLADPYFALTAPKSTGRELFNFNWLQQKLIHYPALCFEDVLATLSQLTATSISQSLTHLSPGLLLICGGGAKNSHLLHNIQALLPNWQIELTTNFGVDGDFMEAMAFAWLAKQCLERQNGNDMLVTGASRNEILGQICQLKHHQWQGDLTKDQQ